MSTGGLGWLGIVRLGLVQTALGSIVVLTTSTLNRLMVVELALPAMIPGALVALHYAVQILRPRMGYGSDMTRRRTPWIVGGMIVLALGGVLASVATALMAQNFAAGMALATLAFLAIGGGVSACGTTLLVLLAKLTHRDRRAAAATIVWLMMIAGFAVTAVVIGRNLDPFSFGRLIGVTSVVAVVAIVTTTVALWGLERSHSEQVSDAGAPKQSFRDALNDVWADRRARLLTIFIFLSMLAYSMQDLVLEPFAGFLFGFTPGQSTILSGAHHGGVFFGMVTVAIAATAIGGPILGSLRLWMVGGCLASALALVFIIGAAFAGPTTPLRPLVICLGFANGVFAIAAISTMMNMAGEGGDGREGTRMGLWGAAQGIAFGLGGFFGTVAVDLARLIVGSPKLAYVFVFALQSLLFLFSAALAARLAASGPVAPIWLSRAKERAEFIPASSLARTASGGAHD